MDSLLQRLHATGLLGLRLHATGLLGLRQDAGICKLALRECISSISTAGRSRRLLLRPASGRLLTSSFGVVAAGSKPSSSSSTSFKCEFPRVKDTERFFRQFIEDCERVVLDKINFVCERADDSVKDGRSCGRTAMAAMFFLALSLLLQHEEAVSAEAMAAVGFELPAAFPWDKVPLEQLEPSKGTCATCIGVVDETLGSCNATANCVSSFDDRPRFFVAPWEFPGKLPFAVEKLREVLLSSGAQIEEQGERYVHAVFTSKEGVVDDVEFLFSNPKEDATVVLRSASRAINSDDKERNRKRLEEIRKSLTWEQVPVLRNRKRAFFFLESPWDTFGPEPPPSFDSRDDLEITPE